MIDLDELQIALHRMKPRQELFNIIKDEMKRRGHWRNHSRGRYQKARDIKSSSSRPGRQ